MGLSAFISAKMLPINGGQMKITSLTLLALAAIIGAVSLAEAFPDHGGPGRGGPGGDRDRWERDRDRDRWERDRWERDRRPGPPGYPPRPMPPPSYPRPMPPPPPSYPPPAPPPSYPPAPAPSYPTYREVFVGRQMINESIDLSAYMSNGDLISQVVVEVNGTSGGTNIMLVVDGQVQDTRCDQSGALVLRPYSTVRVDRYYGRGNVRLQVQGGAYINRILINGNGGYNPNPGQGTLELRSSPYIDISGYRRLSLYNLLSLGNYQGYVIESIEIETTAAYANTINVYANGGQFRGAISVNSGLTYGRLNLGYDVIGRDLYNLEIEATGSATIRNVLVRVRR